MKAFEKKKLKYVSKDTPDHAFDDIKSKAAAYFADTLEFKRARNFLVVKSLAQCAAVVFCYFLLLNSHSILTLFLGFLLFGWTFLIVGINLGHDAAHHCLTGRAKTDNFLFQIIFGLQGISGYLWQIRHNFSHHIFPNVHGYDTDMEITELIVLDPKHQQVKWYHKYQGYYAPFIYSLFSLLWIFYQDFAVLFKKEQGNLIIGKIPVFEIVKLFFFKVIYIAIFLVIPIALIPISAGWIVAAFFTMHFIVSLFLAFTFFISHHVSEVKFIEADVDKKLLNESWVVHQVSTTIDFDTNNKMANFIFGGFNTHIAHHLFPDISHIHYPALTKIIKDTLEEHELHVYQSYSFFKGIVSHLAHLNRLVNDNSYDHITHV